MSLFSYDSRYAFKRVFHEKTVLWWELGSVLLDIQITETICT